MQARPTARACLAAAGLAAAGLVAAGCAAAALAGPAAGLPGTARAAAPAGAAAQAVAGGPPVGELVAALQARYATVRDLSADFEHRVTGGVLSTTDSERGTMRVKRPGKWRFDYTSPEPKSFVSDGITVHAHFPLDREVLVTAVPAGAGASNPAAFLAGRGDLVRDFAAAYAGDAEAPPNTWVVRLTPRRDDADYEWLELAVDRDTLDILRLSTTDFLGAASTYRFSNLRANEGLSDALFDFRIPPNTEVLTDDGPTRP